MKKKILFTEKDNIGTRVDTLSYANSYWLARNIASNPEPYLLYAFDNEEDAKNSLLELPFIHLASDTNKLICTKVLYFGYYQNENGKFEVFIGGTDLSYKIFIKAKKSFIKFNGTLIGELEPDKTVIPKKTRVKSNKEKITFVREQRKKITDKTLIYRIYKAPNSDSAIEFLKKIQCINSFIILL